MRTLITNAVVIDGTGSAPQADSCVRIADHLIEDVVASPSVYYDRADTVLDARGGFVLPGVINHHAHGLTRGPLMILAEPALSDARVRTNLDRSLRQGVTTALNVDGFATVEEAAASSRFHAVSVRVSTLHTPAHLAWAGGEPFDFGGLGPEHRRWTVAKMLERGALAIGEAGPGIDDHWAEYALVPEAVRRLGGSADAATARALGHAAEAGDAGGLAALLAQAGVPDPRADAFLALSDQMGPWRDGARASLDEAIDAAAEHDVPLVLHHTPGTYERTLAAAERLGPKLIAAHSNFQSTGGDDAIDRARAIRERGGLVDIMSGDCFSGRRFFSGPEVTFAMLSAGVVDLLSTDYGGGFWDSMLLLVEEAARAGATTLEEGVRLATSAPAGAVAGLAPDRGVIAAGMVADLVVTHPGHVASVRDVLVAGRSVAMPANDWR